MIFQKKDNNNTNLHKKKLEQSTFTKSRWPGSENPLTALALRRAPCRACPCASLQKEMHKNCESCIDVYSPILTIEP